MLSTKNTFEGDFLEQTAVYINFNSSLKEPLPETAKFGYRQYTMNYTTLAGDLFTGNILSLLCDWKPKLPHAYDRDTCTAYRGPKKLSEIDSKC